MYTKSFLIKTRKQYTFQLVQSTSSTPSPHTQHSLLISQGPLLFKSTLVFKKKKEKKNQARGLSFIY